MTSQRPAVFLDRDGTINVEKNYLHKITDWAWIPGAIDAIRIINETGYLVIVITNQSGIARGYYGEEDVNQLHNQVDELLAKENAHIDAYYFCPHHPDISGACNCRKPSPGMIMAAQAEYNIDLSKSLIIGDKSSDVEAGRNAGIAQYLVGTGYGKMQQGLDLPHFCIKENILDAVNDFDFITS